MPKEKNNSTLIDDPQRCEICGTTITLYPKDFAPCPHCHKRICRKCWSETWVTKNFTAEACAHLAVSDGLSMSSMGPAAKTSINWDWQKALFAVVLVALTALILVFLFNLFIS